MAAAVATFHSTTLPTTWPNRSHSFNNINFNSQSAGPTAMPALQRFATESHSVFIPNSEVATRSSNSSTSTLVNPSGSGVGPSLNPSQVALAHRQPISMPIPMVPNFGPSQSTSTLPIVSAGYPPVNEVDMTRDLLRRTLEHLSVVIARPEHFGGRPIRLVVHGGACMLLHDGLQSISAHQYRVNPQMPRRTTTKDVDYIHRGFVAEMSSLGIHDAGQRLQNCIAETAMHFRLGLDWMNDHADIALPMQYGPYNQKFDPVYTAAVLERNVKLHTVFTSQNCLLTLISVTPFWAVALKLVRYTKWDPGDICFLLRLGVVLSHLEWTPTILEEWLRSNCAAMGYEHYDFVKLNHMRSRINDALNTLKIWNNAVGISAPSSKEHLPPSQAAHMYQAPPFPQILPPGQTVSAHDAMGGVSGTDAPREGWWSTFDQKRKKGKKSVTDRDSAELFVPPPFGPNPSASAPALSRRQKSHNQDQNHNPLPPGVYNVGDWGSSDAKPSSSKSKSRSKSRHRSGSRTETSDVFVPPPIGELNLNEDWNLPVDPDERRREREKRKAREKAKSQQREHESDRGRQRAYDNRYTGAAGQEYSVLPSQPLVRHSNQQQSFSSYPTVDTDAGARLVVLSPGRVVVDPTGEDNTLGAWGEYNGPPEREYRFQTDDDAEMEAKRRRWSKGRKTDDDEGEVFIPMPIPPQPQFPPGSSSRSHAKSKSMGQGALQGTEGARPFPSYFTPYHPSHDTSAQTAPVIPTLSQELYDQATDQFYDSFRGEKAASRQAKSSQEKERHRKEKARENSRKRDRIGKLMGQGVFWGSSSAAETPGEVPTSSTYLNNSSGGDTDIDTDTDVDEEPREPAWKTMFPSPFGPPVPATQNPNERHRVVERTHGHSQSLAFVPGNSSLAAPQHTYVAGQGSRPSSRNPSRNPSPNPTTGMRNPAPYNVISASPTAIVPVNLPTSQEYSSGSYSQGQRVQSSRAQVPHPVHAQQTGHMQVPHDAPPVSASSMDPTDAAQFQFEQQRMQYERERKDRELQIQQQRANTWHTAQQNQQQKQQSNVQQYQTQARYSQPHLTSQQYYQQQANHRGATMPSYPYR